MVVVDMDKIKLSSCTPDDLKDILKVFDSVAYTCKKYVMESGLWVEKESKHTPDGKIWEVQVAEDKKLGMVLSWWPEGVSSGDRLAIELNGGFNLGIQISANGDKTFVVEVIDTELKIPIRRSFTAC